MYNKFKSKSPEFYKKYQQNSHSELNFVYKSPRNKNFKIKRQHTIVMMKNLISKTKSVLGNSERRNGILLTDNQQPNESPKPYSDKV